MARSCSRSGLSMVGRSTVRRAARTVSVAVLLAATAASTAGCDTTGVTAERVQAAFAPAFARLWVRQQRLEGHPAVPSVASMAPTATCTRGDASVPDVGAGSDWSCTVAFFISGPGTPVSLVYGLTVRPDGCWTAEDPPVAMGRQTITTATGRTVLNPVFAIDGCFATA